MHVDENGRCGMAKVCAKLSHEIKSKYHKHLSWGRVSGLARYIFIYFYARRQMPLDK